MLRRFDVVVKSGNTQSGNTRATHWQWVGRALTQYSSRLIE